MRSLVSTLGLSLLLALSLAACKQGEFETCQINSDCEDGFDCTPIGSHGECRPKGSAGDDGGIAQDAFDGDAADGSIDASGLDAATDAATDAAVFDAATIDAP